MIYNSKRTRAFFNFFLFVKSLLKVKIALFNNMFNLFECSSYAPGPGNSSFPGNFCLNDMLNPFELDASKLLDRL